MTCSPMVRDFFDETGVPILYMDLTMQMLNNAKDLFKGMDSFHSITVGAYQIMGRLGDVPLTTEYCHKQPQTCKQFNDLFGLAYQSAAIGYCFGAPEDHMSTPAIPDEETRSRLADEGAELIEALVSRMNLPHITEQMRNLEAYNHANEEKYPWMPSAFQK